MFASFFGIYKVNENGERKNLLKDYKLGMEFGKTRVITAEVDNDVVSTTIYDSEGNVVEQEEGVEYKEEDGYRKEEVFANSEEVKNKENYKKTKSIIEQRLNKTNVAEYTIDLDEQTGKMKIEIPENEKTQEVINLIETESGFMLLDGEKFESVFDDSYIKDANVLYSQVDLDTAVLLQINLTNEGKQKLEELGNIYTRTTEEKENENGETETVTNSKTLWVILNGQLVGIATVSDIAYDGSILLNLGISSDNNEIQQIDKAAKYEAILLNSGISPIVYSYSSETNESRINGQDSIILLCAIAVVFVIAYIFLIVKYSAKGFISIYLQIGFLAVLLLVTRLTNVILTMEGIAGIVISMVMELLFTYIVLENMKNNKTEMYKKSNLEFFLNTLPIYIVALVFSFAGKAYISSLGMTLFWGIILVYVYNFIFSKFIYENLNMEVKNEEIR